MAAAQGGREVLLRLHVLSKKGVVLFWGREATTKTVAARAGVKIDATSGGPMANRPTGDASHQRPDTNETPHIQTVHTWRYLPFLAASLFASAHRDVLRTQEERPGGAYFYVRQRSLLTLAAYLK